MDDTRGGVAFDAIAINLQMESQPSPDAPEDLYQLCTDVLATVDGDLDQATSRMARTLSMRYPVYWAALTRKAVHQCVRELIAHTVRQERSAIADGEAITSKARRRAADASSMLAVARGFLDWPVLPGLVLRDATRPTLIEVSARYLRDAKSMRARGTWLQSIAERLADDDTPAGAVLDEKTVATLARKHGVAKDN